LGEATPRTFSFAGLKWDHHQIVLILSPHALPWRRAQPTTPQGKALINMVARKGFSPWEKSLLLHGAPDHTTSAPLFSFLDG